MSIVYLLIGGNQDNPAENLARAVTSIEKKIGTVIRRSSIYRTAAWGNTHQPDFLNEIVIAETFLTARQTLYQCLSIEKQMGRVRTFKNAPRIIDIDILFFDKEICNDIDLVVPHPQIQNRRFVLTPLNELSPLFKHPVLNKTIHHLLSICPDHLDVKKI